MKKILIAEDEPMLLKTLAYRIEKSGYQIIGAVDGLQAIEFFKIEKPDLVITDILMPFATGLELTSHIRKNLNSTVPVIMLTAVATENMILDSFELGINDYVTKPFIPNELMIRIQRLINL